jgi:hypothetical protein
MDPFESGDAKNGLEGRTRYQARLGGSAFGGSSDIFSGYVGPRVLTSISVNEDMKRARFDGSSFTLSDGKENTMCLRIKSHRLGSRLSG